MNGGNPVATSVARRRGGLFIVFFLVAACMLGAALFFPALALVGLCVGIILAAISAVFVVYGAIREPTR